LIIEYGIVGACYKLPIAPNTNLKAVVLRKWTLPFPFKVGQSVRKVIINRKRWW